jgi:circadian clock protein KaiC
LTKALTGIQGFDEIIEGGVPRRRPTLMLGAAGRGKAVFALQSLVNAARHSEGASIFVAFEENTAQIIDNASRTRCA